jgi:signal transduction histidine kinase
MEAGIAPSGTGAVARARRVLPRGHTLPPEELRRRHRALLVLLWLHVLAVPVWGVVRGFGVGHSLVEAGAIAVCAAAATLVGARPRAGAALVSLGLLTASAVVVHLSDGAIEAHFHFVVVIVLLTLYEDWMAFLLAVAFVALHHGVGGALDPHAVFNHPDAEAHPWRWALIHAGAIGAAASGAIAAWRLNEDLRDQHIEVIAAKQAALERATAAERELDRHAGELERSNRELEEFAAIASHDLSAPLVTVAGFLTLLEERYAGRLGPDADELIAHAVDGTRRMQRLIGDLLEYSRVGCAGLAPEDVDLAAVVRETLAGLRAAIDETGAEVVVDPLPVVRADSRQLARLLQNLISNALKFTAGARPVVHVTAQATDRGWEIAIVDNGVGVDPAERELIFKMFHRPPRGGDVDGTGMGLAICQRIVERHGGRIWVDPAPGGGSAFRFVLPHRADAPAEPAGVLDDAAQPRPSAAAA